MQYNFAKFEDLGYTPNLAGDRRNLQQAPTQAEINTETHAQTHDNTETTPGAKAGVKPMDRDCYTD